ncbi:MAG: hypothetical protein NTW87_20150 [Planctomycetota bacterium]|nr:hypothetical protein [Planctomycetota bacterium]
MLTVLPIARRRRNPWVAAASLIAVMVLLSPVGIGSGICGEPFAAEVVLNDTWQVQPATSPDVPPKAEDWGALSGDWRWSPLKADGTSWQAAVKSKRSTVHCLWFEQSSRLPQEWAGRRIGLDLRRLEGDAIVFFNGHRVAELLRPGGELDVTAHARLGEDNVIRVFVTRNYTGISRPFEKDPLRYTARGPHAQNPTPVEQWPMGITAQVRVLALPRPAALTDVFAITSFRNKTVTMEIETDADQPAPNAVLETTITDGDGKTVLTFASARLSLPPGRSLQRVEAKWENPILWELERGYLYTATVCLRVGEQVVDRKTTTFGFREIWTEGRQIMLNGHVSRWRVDWMSCGLNEHSLSFFRLMGRNVFYYQCNESAWWCTWSETPLLDERLLQAFDAQGMGALLLSPSVGKLRQALLTDPQAQADYEREMKRWVRLYRNHPCVLAWTIGMNSFCPRDGIHPDTMGKRVDYKGGQADVIRKGLQIAKRHDPTRLVYSHADGNLTDISTSNSYLNFAPLQEREEWPMEWAAAGDMPYFPVEFGQPYTANFWKGKQFLMTEYLAMYFGDEAYRTETENGRKRILPLSLGNVSGHGADMSVGGPGKGATSFDDYPLYWEFQRLFVRNTDRSWRTWGVPGYYYWDFAVGYGDPPGWDKKNIFSHYASIREPLRGRPDWANPNFDIRAENEQPLLAYLAGTPRHTDKTHAFYSGELLRKQVAVVWDGPGRRALLVEWGLVGSDGKAVASGAATLNAAAGDIVFAPIETALPTVQQRTELKLSLSVKDGEAVVARDVLALQVFPKPPAMELKARVAVLDPKGLSKPWLRTAGVPTELWQPGQPLDNVELLVVGREALGPGQKLPYAPQDIARGLKVIIFEQRPEVWEGLGFKSIETMPRHVFVRDATSPILSGLHPGDLINWRGSPNLLPECKAARAGDVMHAPKWTNTHAVASCVLQIPHVVGFTPVLVSEFDLDYTPLLEFRHGQGRVFYSTLDFSGRVGLDPAATLLVRNLLLEAATPVEPTRTVYYAGGSKGKTLLDQLRVAVEPTVSLDSPAQTLLVLGEGHAMQPDALKMFAGKGGRAFVLPRAKAELEAAGFKIASVEWLRAPEPTAPRFKAIGPGLLRWRDTLKLSVFEAQGQPANAEVHAGGAFLLQRDGAGFHLHCQIDPLALRGRYAADTAEHEATQLTQVRLMQLASQLLTNCGATPSTATAQRLATLLSGPSYETLGHWNVLGPFEPEPNAVRNVPLLLDTEFPGEKAAVAGDTNPNIQYARKDGKALDFRPTVQANKDDYLDLQALLKTTAEGSVAYVTRGIRADKARTATLRFGIDYWAKVWVNGTVVYRMDHGHGAPMPNRHCVRVPLNAGENVITLKLVSGSRGFGFWANLSREDSVEEPPDGAARGPVLYQQEFKLKDPYEYIYW